MIRNILAVIVGLVVGGVLNMTIIQFNMNVLYPAPKGMDPNDVDQFNAYLSTLPTMAFVVVIVAHLAQAFIGGWVAARLAKSRPFLLAMIVGALSLVGGILAMTMFKGPDWMIIEFPLYLILAALAGRHESSRRARK
ncbi:YrzE family protein [Planctomycetota bacterium]|nr:YrzE family protein [Planctomycetota bacterium]